MYEFEMTLPQKKAMDLRMANQHRTWRSKLRQHFYEAGGKEDKEKAKRFPHPDCTDEADWHWLCDYFGSPKQLVSAK